MGRRDSNSRRRRGGIVVCSCGRNLGRVQNEQQAKKRRADCARRGHTAYQSGQ